MKPVSKPNAWGIALGVGIGLLLVLVPAMDQWCAPTVPFRANLHHTASREWNSTAYGDTFTGWNLSVVMTNLSPSVLEAQDLVFVITNSSGSIQYYDGSSTLSLSKVVETFNPESYPHWVAVVCLPQFAPGCQTNPGYSATATDPDGQTVGQFLENGQTEGESIVSGAVFYLAIPGPSLAGLMVTIGYTGHPGNETIDFS
jgi:hypothetical protein